MIDTFALLLIHGLLALVGIRLMARDDLDREEPPAPISEDPAE